MATPLRLLLVEDSEDDAALLVRELRRGGYEPAARRVDSPAEMKDALASGAWDLVISDHAMPRFSAPAALAVLQETGLDLPFIIVSGTIGEELAVSAMKAGAHDYILKDRLARLVPAVERELREASAREERRRADAQLREALYCQAYFDPLTSLPNRALFVETVREWLLDRPDTPVAVLVVDIERFRHVNTILGDRNGDRLLCEAGSRLATLLPADAILARLNADAFALAVPGPAVPPSMLASTVLRAFADPFAPDDLAVQLDASVGLGLYPDHGPDVETLLRHGESALRMARELGTGWAVYEPARDPHRPERLALAADLPGALARGELWLAYQPQVGLRTGAATGVEALLRWQHPARGLILPDAFIALVEQTAFVRPLTAWVIERALSDLRAWREDGLELEVAVNVSARNLLDPALPDQVGAALARHGLTPEALTVEVTESAVMADLDGAVESARRLRALGVRFALDDFGTGYSSFQHLHRLDLDQVKIDRSFVHEAERSERGRAIVRSLVDLGRNLGLTVVAEGVEGPRGLALLRQLGATAVQGYHVAMPMPAAELLAWARAYRGLAAA